MESLWIKKKHEKWVKDPTKAKEEFTRNFLQKDNAISALHMSVTHDRPFLMKTVLQLNFMILAMRHTRIWSSEVT
jgi:hypothetical protein